MISRVPLFFLLLSLCAGAQNTTPQPKPDYSHEAVVIQQSRTAVRFENDGTGERHITSRVRVQSEAGVQALGVLRFMYDQATQEIQIGYVRVRKPDGAVVETPAASIQDLPAEVTREAPIYSDVREKHINVTALRPGDVLETDVTVRMKASLVPGQFWFEADMEKDAITLSEEIVLDVPADRVLKLKVAPELKTEARTEAGRKIYRWSGANLEHQDAAARAKQKAVAPDTEKTAPAIQATTFQSWDELARWFSEIQRERVMPTPEVKAKAAELVRGLDSDEAKTQAIYDFVAKEIRYIGLEFGIGRFQANPAASVLANRYGDCKDKHTLLAAMLQAVGISASPVLVHTTRKLDPDLPSLSQFNHVITMVNLGARRVFLDTTTEVAPFGMLIYPLRDQQVLLIGQTGEAEIVRTPAETPFAQFQKLHGEGKIDEKGNVTADISQTFRGDLELVLRLAFRHSGADKFKELAQQVAAMTGFGGEVSNVTTSDVENTREPLQIKYHYTRGDYFDWTGDSGTAKMLVPGIAMPGADTSGTAKDQPIKLGPPTTIEYEGKIEFPRSVTILEPRKVDLLRDYANYHCTYKLEGHTLTLKRSLEVKTHEVPAAKRSDYAEFWKSAFNDGWQNAVASRTPGTNSPANASTTAAPNASDNEAAQAAYEEGGRALMRGDMLTARTSYQKALRLDPKHPDGWAALARLEATSNDIDAALHDLRKQLEVNPKHPEANFLLARILLYRGDKAGAMAALKNQIAVNPDDSRPYGDLGSLYSGDKNYKDAVPLLEKAVTFAPDDQNVALALATAYIETGATDKASATYEKILAADHTPDTLNNISYVLADHGLQLEHALDLGQQAVRQLEEGLNGVRLDNVTKDDIKNTTLLLATWDTVGWAYYKHGDMEKARSYLAASWTSWQGSTIADHLAAVYERLGMKAKAAEMRSYFPAGAQPQTITVHQNGQTITWQRPSRAMAAPRPTGTIQSLQELRTVRLTRHFRSNANAEFFLLLSPAGVEEVRFISGSDSLKSWIETLKSARIPVAFPEGAGGKLVRKGVLSCSSYTADCMFVLYDPNSVNVAP